jgi:Leucine-rich repeat (LRR) protein
LRTINLAYNKIEDPSSIACNKYLIKLNLKKNNIKKLSHFNVKNELNFLEELDLSQNDISEL